MTSVRKNKKQQKTSTQRLLKAGLEIGKLINSFAKNRSFLTRGIILHEILLDGKFREITK